MKTQSYSMEEIAVMYRDAKNKREQINILADLNLCSKNEIIRKLKFMGFDVPQKKPSYPEDLTGLVFGKMTVVERLYTNNKNTKWLCRCECGKEKRLSRYTLIGGGGQSCSCGKGKKEK